jgi:hypothetical protein
MRKLRVGRKRLGFMVLGLWRVLAAEDADAGCNAIPLAMPDLPLVNLPITVQLHNAAGECWQAVYATPTKNDDAQFSAKGQ